MIFCEVFDVIGDSGPRLATARATTSLKNKKSFLPFSFHVLLGKKEETGRGERERALAASCYRAQLERVKRVDDDGESFSLLLRNSRRPNCVGRRPCCLL